MQQSSASDHYQNNPHFRANQLALAQQISDKAKAAHPRLSLDSPTLYVPPATTPHLPLPSTLHPSPINPTPPLAMAQQYSYAQPNGHSAPPFVHGLSSQPPSSLFTNGMNPTALVPGSMVPGNLAGSFPRPGSSGGPRRAGGVTRTLEEAQAQYLRQTAEANAGHLPRQNPTSFPNSFASISAPTPSRTASDSQRPPAPPPTLTEPTDGGPPFKVPLHNFFTRQTPLAPGVPFPSIDPADQVRVKGWMERDKEYEASLMSARGDSRVRMRELGEEMWKRGDWLGEKGPTTHTKVKMEPERARDRERGKRGPNRKELKL